MTTQSVAPQRDKPWLFRTYAGHSSAAASNQLFRTNLARGQTGLSVAFDLPTQTGYDSDHQLALGEVGRVGVPITSISDMLTLFDGIPLDQSNTSMTINATAPWLLALYIAVAERQGVSPAKLEGTIQNDLIKEFLARGTYMLPPRPSLDLTADVITYAVREIPKWNPTNICSYHLQEAGATPVQEVAFALGAAIAVLDTVRQHGGIPDSELPKIVGRLSFFVNAGVRFLTEMCKMRAFTELWDELTRERYRVEDPKLRRFRYGVQVNSLGLTEQQPENNVYRILLSALAVTLSKDARCRALQLPAWNEALGLPRPWDQQWSLRLQQILALETDLLEFGDLFRESEEVGAKVAEIKAAAKQELARIEEMGGVLAAIETGYMKRCLVESSANRLAAIASGEQKMVGVNCYTETAPSPLVGDAEGGGFQDVDPKAEAEQIERLRAHRQQRDAKAVDAALRDLQVAASEGRNVMPASIACAHAGATTGEWAHVLRDVFGEYRAPTGVGITASPVARSPELDQLRKRVDQVSAQLGRRLKILVGKPGLDGHSNGAEQVAVAARDCGLEVVYEGIRLTPSRIVNAALEEGVHVIGLSILSGAHNRLVAEIMRHLREAGLSDVPVVLGGIIPHADEPKLRAEGVARIFTPKDFALDAVMAEIIGLVEDRLPRAA